MVGQYPEPETPGLTTTWASTTTNDTSFVGLWAPQVRDNFFGRVSFYEFLRDYGEVIPSLRINGAPMGEYSKPSKEDFIKELLD